MGSSATALDARALRAEFPILAASRPGGGALPFGSVSAIGQSRAIQHRARLFLACVTIHQPVLERLKTADRNPELLALLHVSQRLVQ